MLKLSWINLTADSIISSPLPRGVLLIQEFDPAGLNHAVPGVSLALRFGLTGGAPTWEQAGWESAARQPAACERAVRERPACESALCEEESHVTEVAAEVTP